MVNERLEGRLNRMRSVAVICCLMLFGCALFEEPPSKGLILISLDTLRADRVGMHRAGRPLMPSVERLADDGVLFEQCYAHAPSTLPSHASIMTSLLPPHHGAYYARKSKLAPGVITIAELLSRAGYRTASFNDGGQLAATWGLDRGFDRYESDVVKRETESGGIVRDYRLILAVKKAIGWLEEDDSRPFFVFLHSYEVHHPYTPSEADVEALGEAALGYRKRVSVDQLRAINEGRLLVNDEERRHIQDAYNAEVLSADRAVGHLVSKLKEMGLYEDTMIVFTSDHGEEFDEHGKIGWHSHSLHDELLHVPLIIKFPRGRFGETRVTTQVRSIDIAPTVLAHLGIESPPQFIGKDLSSRADSGWQWELPVLSYQDTPEGMDYWSLREKRWKLYYDRPSDFRLYDLRNDAEALVSQGTQPGLANAMKKRKRAMLKERSFAVQTTTRPAAETEENLRALGYTAD